jgi:hypothetical protein
MSPNARAYYPADIAQFASSSVAAILGNLAANTDFDIELAQRNAWSEQIPILKTALSGIEGSIFLEFVVPHIASRIDLNSSARYSNSVAASSVRSFPPIVAAKRIESPAVLLPVPSKPRRAGGER